MAESSEIHEIDPLYPENVKDEFLDVYKEICDQLSKELFSDILELLKNDNVEVKMDTAILTFKALLLDEMSNSFEQIWQSRDIPQSLIMMEQLKKNFENHTDPQWRPYGHSPLQQTIPLRVKVLQKRQKYWEGILEQQKHKLETVVSQVEDDRQLFEQHILRRNTLLDQMKVRSEKLALAKNELTQQLVATVDKL